MPICKKCGREIEKARLRAMPGADICARCIAMEDGREIDETEMLINEFDLPRELRQNLRERLKDIQCREYELDIREQDIARIIERERKESLFDLEVQETELKDRIQQLEQKARDFSDYTEREKRRRMENVEREIEELRAKKMADLDAREQRLEKKRKEAEAKARERNQEFMNQKSELEKQEKRQKQREELFAKRAKELINYAKRAFNTVKIAELQEKQIVLFKKNPREMLHGALLWGRVIIDKTSYTIGLEPVRGLKRKECWEGNVTETNAYTGGVPDSFICIEVNQKNGAFQGHLRLGQKGYIFNIDRCREELIDMTYWFGTVRPMNITEAQKLIDKSA